MPVHGSSDPLRTAGGSRSCRVLADPSTASRHYSKIQGNEQPALSVKLMEVLYVPWALHWLSLLRSQTDTSRLAHLDYPEGTFPTGENLSMPSRLSTRRRTRSSTWSSLLCTNRWW
jgi:hypothetical protein